MTSSRTSRSAAQSSTAATSPPGQRHLTAQASRAPITQKPGMVAFMSGPLTSGETRIAASATARSATSRSGVRRAGSAYAQTVKAVHATIAATTATPAAGWSKLSAR